MIHQIGAGEGALNLIAWAGYTQKSWVKPFEDQTGCTVSVKTGNTSDEMVSLMRQQGGTAYDGVSASGDATNRLIAAGDVALKSGSKIDVSGQNGGGTVSIQADKSVAVGKEDRQSASGGRVWPDEGDDAFGVRLII